MKAKVFAAAAAGVLASVAIPAVSASAAPAGNGASVVFQQDGNTTHTLCAFDDVWLAASGFSAGRKSVVASIQIVGYGVLFSAPIHLTAGSGAVDTGSPGPDFIGAKVRARYEVGSSEHPIDSGSFSATIVDC